jgi:hypothetical protein
MALDVLRKPARAPSLFDDVLAGIEADLARAVPAPPAWRAAMQVAAAAKAARILTEQLALSAAAAELYGWRRSYRRRLIETRWPASGAHLRHARCLPRCTADRRRYPAM